MAKMLLRFRLSLSLGESFKDFLYFPRSVEDAVLTTTGLEWPIWLLKAQVKYFFKLTLSLLAVLS